MLVFDQITMPDCPVYPPHVPGTMLRARTQDLRDQKNETGLLRLRSIATMDQPAMAEVLE